MHETCCQDCHTEDEVKQVRLLRRKTREAETVANDKKLERRCNANHVAFEQLEKKREANSIALEQSQKKHKLNRDKQARFK